MTHTAQMDFAIEYRQHVTGAQFWDDVLVHLCSGALGASELVVHVRELTMMDPELALAVINIRSRASKRSPTFGWVGLVSKDHLSKESGTFVRANVEAKILSHLSYGVNAGTYLLSGCNPLGRVGGAGGAAGAGGAVQGAPTQPPLTHTVPSEKGELRLKQELYDSWGSHPHFKADWEAFAAQHNKTFNPSGVPHRAGRRPADMAVEEAERAASAALLQSPPGTPSTIDDLRVKCPDGLREVPLQSGCSLFLAPGHGLYLVNTRAVEVLVELAEPLFQLRGTWCQQEVDSNALMAKVGANWIDYNVTADTVVMAKCVGEPAIPLPSGAIRMEALLQALERAGQVRVALQNHTCERVGDTSQYKIQMAKACAMELAPAASGEVTLATVGHNVSIRLLKERSLLQIIQHLQYVSREKKLVPYYPGVHLKQNGRLAANQAVCLVGHAAPAAGA
jgi:hypothetical protein